MTNLRVSRQEAAQELIKRREIRKPIAAFEDLYRPKRFKSYYGGRGSAKSEEFAKYVLSRVRDHNQNWLCAREFQNSIDDSSHSLLKHKIEQLGYSKDFTIRETEIICNKNGKVIKYIGLARHIESAKSKFGFDGVWIEEAETVSDRSWKVLIPTIRAEGSEIISSWNPKDLEAATYKRIIAGYEEIIKEQGFYEDDYMFVKKVSHRDNPYFPETLRQEMEKDKRTDYKTYLHVWEGECDFNYADSIIEAEWVDAAIDAHLKLNFAARGECVTAFDPADEGSDSKALTKRKGVLITKVAETTDGDIDSAIDWAFEEAFSFQSDVFVYDSIGVGAAVKVGLTNRLQHKRLKVHEFIAGASPTNGFYDEPVEIDGQEQRRTLNKDKFYNKRAQYWWLLRERFRKTYLAVTKNEYFDPLDMISLSGDIDEKMLLKLKNELVKQPRKRASGSTLIQMMSKDEMRRKGISSPNIADSLMMSFAVDDIPVVKVAQHVPIPSRNNPAAFRR